MKSTVQQDPGIEVIWQNRESLTFSGRAEMDFAKYATLQVLYFYFSFNLLPKQVDRELKDTRDS